jgi:pimeloyl-ACP methyl ester carboxylesterase
MRSTDFRFTSRDGLQIACTRWDARGEARGIVQIAHGMGNHIGRYRDTIEALVAAGLTVYGNDHRGHGRTATSHERLGDFGAGGFDLLVEDMVVLSLIVRQEHPGAPLFLLGHGLGSFAAQQYAVYRSRDIEGLILSGSGTLDVLARLATSAPFTTDPLCFRMLQPRSMASFLAAVESLSDPARLRGVRRDLPVYRLSDSEDPAGGELAVGACLVDWILARRQRARIDVAACEWPMRRAS